MSEKTLKFIVIAFFLVLLGTLFSGPCNKPRHGNVNINIQTTTAYAADGLDLQAVGELVKKAKDAEHLEKLLNSRGGVNNLDLNEDGKVDYINVSEYGNDRSKGFSLTVQPASGEIQEVATIEIEKSGENAGVEVRGNEQIYGRHHYYHGTHLLTDLLLIHYLFRPHPFYMSPWHYGHYPGYYGRGYATVSRNNYRNTANSINRSSTAKKSSKSRMSSSLRSPNQGKSAGKGVRAPLKNPTVSQKSFQARNPSKSVSKGGFGRSSRSSYPSRPSVRSGGFGRSGGFSGGK